MNIAFILLILFIFILPFSFLRRVYSYDAPDHRYSKIFNVISTIILIIILSSENSNLRTILTDFNDFKQVYFINLGGVNKWVILIGKLILIAVNFYLVVVLINTVRRSKKYRQRLIYVLLLLIPLKGLDVYSMIYSEFDEPWTKMILISLLTSMTFLLPLLIFYMSKSAKRMMILDDNIKNEILQTMKQNNWP